MKTEDDLGGAEEPAAPPTARGNGPALSPKAHTHLVDLPESRSYRFKNKALGPPLQSDQLANERLGKPTALAVFASDNLSSSAYATEEFLRVLVPVAGVAAFGLVVPLTGAMLVVLFLLILSYRQTIKAYPSAGGAYIVTKDNFGTTAAQVAGISLLAGYILTAAVSVAAGAAALASFIPDLAPFVVPISIVFLLIIAGGNLKGVKESGKAFAVPTYFFIANMVLLIGVGAYRYFGSGLDKVEVENPAEVLTQIPGQYDTTMWMGVGLFVMLHAFASGGAAVTGVEAISNGVPAFKEPSSKNARDTLVIMGSLLGVMFLGLSLLASQVNPAPYREGTPTVISQIGEVVYHRHAGGIGFILWASLQLGTMLILVLAANTSYADFPRLASFQATDSFLPRQLTKRGHRLVFSNGIIALTAVSIVLLVVTGAKVERLIPLYAIGVFTGFVLSQAGMAKRHIRLKEKGWRMGLLINGVGAILSAVVLVVSAIFKFTEGAWIIILAIPLAVIPLFRLNRQYEDEREALSSGEATSAALQEKILDRHNVIVLIDQLDMAAARAIQYARTLVPDELRAVHFDMDPLRSKELTDGWVNLGFNRIALDVVDCPDRRLERGVAELVARELVNGNTEVTVLMPRRKYSRLWARLVHDNTADKIAETLSSIPHCNVTIVPFHIGAKAGTTPTIRAAAAAELVGDLNDHGAKKTKSKSKAKAKAKSDQTIDTSDMHLPSDRTQIAAAAHRQQVKLAGKVFSVRVKPWSGTPALELTLLDETGAIVIVFFGRRSLAGVGAGSRLVVEGVVGEHRGKLAMLNPAYEIQVDPHDLEHAPT